MKGDAISVRLIRCWEYYGTSESHSDSKATLTFTIAGWAVSACALVELETINLSCTLTLHPSVQDGEMAVDEQDPPGATSSEPPAPEVLEREDTPTGTRPVAFCSSPNPRKVKASADIDVTRKTDSPNRPVETPKADLVEPMETEAQPSSSETGASNAAEVPDLNLAPISGEAEPGRERGELDRGEIKVEPGGKENVPGDSAAVPQDPGVTDPVPGVDLPGSGDSGEKDEDSVPALLEEDNEDEKEEEFWGRSASKLDTVERSLSGLLATSRPEEGRGDQAERGKEGKKGQFFKRGEGTGKRC